MSKVDPASLTPYEQLIFEAGTDESAKKEISEEKRVGFYRLKHKLGSGNFSEVKFGTHLLTKDKVAIKILDKFKLDSKTQKLVTREMDIMQKVYHPHTVRFYEQIETISKMYIVIEYCDCGDLQAKVRDGGKISEKDAQPIYAQIISAIGYLHSVRIVHRDIKAENIYYATPKFIKVGDFGFSTFASREDNLSTFCGSPPYAAPELLKDQTYNGQQVDIWALGVLLYFMVTGVMPFRADTLARLKAVITAAQYDVPDFVSPACVALMRGILRPSGKDRMSVSQIRKSPWLEDQVFVISYDEVAGPRRREQAAEAQEQMDAEKGKPESDVEPKVDTGKRHRRRKHRHRHRRRHRNRGQEAVRDAEVREVMNNLGISNDAIDRQQGNLRSNIVGVYRLLLHGLEKQTFQLEGELEGNYSPLLNSLKKNGAADDALQAQSGSPSGTANGNQKSSTCAVL